MMTSPSDIAPAKTTFVCCIESGFLEAQTVRMIESWRRWGGRWRDASIVAVTPRFGAPLSSQTQKVLQRLNVEHLSFQAPNPYSWKAFLNKHYSLAAVEAQSTSDFIGWLDSDLLIVGEPDQLFLEEGCDFRACPVDRAGATTGAADDPMEAYWREVCEKVGLSIDDLPWVTTELEGQKVRFYFNSGVFLYRRSTELSKQHLENTIKLFDSRLASQLTGIYFTQHMLGITVAQMKLPWSCLPHSHNYSTGAKTYPRWNDVEKLTAAKILHYHDAMWPAFWPTFLSALEPINPEVISWLQAVGPLQNTAPVQWRFVNKFLQSQRAKQESKFKASCKII